LDEYAMPDGTVQLVAEPLNVPLDTSSEPRLLNVESLSLVSFQRKFWLSWAKTGAEAVPPTNRTDPGVALVNEPPIEGAVLEIATSKVPLPISVTVPFVNSNDIGVPSGVLSTSAMRRGPLKERAGMDHLFDLKGSWSL
jgi:hypothetical protein